MTGTTRTVRKAQRIRVGTTPVVILPAQPPALVGADLG